MTDQQPATPLADRALARLRKVAAGNGLEPAAITLIEIQESDFSIGGVMEVSPMTEASQNVYPGGARGKDRKGVGSFAALQQAAEQHQKAFRESPDWLEAVTKEIKTHESQGWGLENAKVTLPQNSAIFAASETCPSCQGRKALTCNQCHGEGTVICTQCQGQGREQCYYCGGRGENPQQPGQQCPTCNGTRLAPCRFCQARKFLPCPTCNGKRGTPCTPCQGTGRITQEIAVTCGAETHFKLEVKDLPSGLRRGLERIGIAKLGKGHADIAVVPPSNDKDAPRDKAPFPVLTYKVTLPYAELRMGFGSKKAIVSAFGKRCVIMGAPNFLDESLKPWRDKLRDATHGKAPLEEATTARALKELLGLTVTGKGRLDEVRKIYPVGISNDAINSILVDMRLALNRTTLKTRTGVAMVCTALCACIFYELFMAGLVIRLTMGWSALPGFALCFGFLGAALGTSWAMLNFSTRFMLRKRFPQLPLSLRQKIGKTGISMLAAITLSCAAFLFLAPVRVLWLASLLR